MSKLLCKIGYCEFLKAKGRPVNHQCSAWQFHGIDGEVPVIDNAVYIIGRIFL